MVWEHLGNVSKNWSYCGRNHINNVKPAVAGKHFFFFSSMWQSEVMFFKQCRHLWNMEKMQMSHQHNHLLCINPKVSLFSNQSLCQRRKNTHFINTHTHGLTLLVESLCTSQEYTQRCIQCSTCAGEDTNTHTNYTHTQHTLILTVWSQCYQGSQPGFLCLRSTQMHTKDKKSLW